jgi:hypothetical protein
MDKVPNLSLSCCHFLNSGCAYGSLMEGHVSERLHTRENRVLLLNFLLTELEAARMINVNKPDLSKTMEVQLVSIFFSLFS